MLSTLGPFAFCLGVALSSSEKNKSDAYEKRKKVHPKNNYLLNDSVKDFQIYRAVQMTEEHLMDIADKANSKLLDDRGAINIQGFTSTTIDRELAIEQAL